MGQQISIHKTLYHPNIVHLIKYFEDNFNIYILLEFVGNKSLSEVISKRNKLTELEVKYYSK